jgi:hypothetical protein
MGFHFVEMGGRRKSWPEGYQMPYLVGASSPSTTGDQMATDQVLLIVLLVVVVVAESSEEVVAGDDWVILSEVEETASSGCILR